MEASSLSLGPPINVATFFKNQHIKNTSPKTSRECTFVGTQGQIFFLYSSDEDGLYKIEINIANAWRELADDTVEAGRLTIIDIPFFIPNARLVFEAKAAPTVFSAEAYGYPVVYRKQIQADRY